MKKSRPTVKREEVLEDETSIPEISMLDSDTEMPAAFEEEAEEFDDNDNMSFDDDEDDELEEDPDVEDEEEEEEVESEDEVSDEEAEETRVVAPESDSEDENGPENRIGNVPREWYDEFPHIGYDVNGKKIMKPAKGDELDRFLDQMDDPDDWRTIQDPVDIGKSVVLSKEEIDIINRIYRGEHADAGYDPYQPYVDFFTKDVRITPILDAPEPKRRFIPSKWEHKRVMKIVRAIRKGLIVFEKKPEKPKFFDIWANSDNSTTSKLNANYISAPKMKLPQHNESYNPPEEYLFTEEEKAEYLALDPQDRPQNFIPQKFSCLRNVPAYPRFIQERFERCLDLYLCPRVKKNRLNIDPNSLIPKLPDPKDLRPFPTTRVVSYKGHEGRIRTLSIDPTGQWLASGSDDNKVKIWELITGRCMKTLTFSELVRSVCWNPNPSISLLSIVLGHKVILVQPGMARGHIAERTNSLILNNKSIEMKSASGMKQNTHVEWKDATSNSKDNLVMLELFHQFPVKTCSWHKRGDYFTSLAVNPNGQKGTVLVHQLSKKVSQIPFKQQGDPIQSVSFHPTKPHFLVVTQRNVKIYDLSTQNLVSKLSPGMQWISSLSIHPNGDHLLLGSYDKKVSWMDLDLGQTPYKTLRYHSKAVRQVSFHNSYPLFATAADEGHVHVFHGRVYQDLLTHPLIVPVKVLKAHSVSKDGLGVLDCEFHPKQPWLVTAGADHEMHLYV